jgi:hypothetical protein
LHQVFDDSDYKESHFTNGDCSGVPNAVAFKPFDTCNNPGIYNIIFGGYFCAPRLLSSDLSSNRYQKLPRVRGWPAFHF